MFIPDLLTCYRDLIAQSTISSDDLRLDQPNLSLISRLACWFETLGFRVEISEVAPGKYNLLASKGSGEGGLLLSGHTDTVPCDESRWSSDPLKLTERDGRLYGLGAADMKGFFAFILDAVQSMEWGDQRKPLYVLATCDEETSMLGARHFSGHSSLRPDCCVIGEPTSLRPVRAHKGHLSQRVRITGRSGHSSDPARGINALEIMHRVMGDLLSLRQKLSTDYHHSGFEIPHPTLNLGSVHGGDSPNRICGCCELSFDIRPLPGLSLDGLDNLLQESLSGLKERWGKALSIESLHPPIPGYECSEQAPVVGIAEKITGSRATCVNYCTEAPFLQQLAPTVVLGPGSIAQAHQADEYLALDMIRPTRQILQRLFRHFCF
ncbi:acetylornithine deacetylase [Dongshaea marina]|uniref:acetylornithine deacetylase n=1 Tax=Dongshaea marina TaxID=2047966 RepID=UPI000D3EC803|nr:acetylornithine deacetylase [Dongshaea marina]